MVVEAGRGHVVRAVSRNTPTDRAPSGLGQLRSRAAPVGRRGATSVDPAAPPGAVTSHRPAAGSAPRGAIADCHGELRAGAAPNCRVTPASAVSAARRSSGRCMNPEL